MLLALLLAASPYDFAAQRVTSKVIIYIKEDFAYPERIKLPEMYRAALERLGKDFPALRLSVDAQGALTLGSRRHIGAAVEKRLLRAVGSSRRVAVTGSSSMTAGAPEPRAASVCLRLTRH